MKPQDQTIKQWYEDYDKPTSEVSKMDMSKYAEGDNEDLKAADYIGMNLKVVISAVTEKHFDAKEGMPATDRGRLSFKGKEKGVVLNPTNTKILMEAYGIESDGWIGHEIGLTVQEYETYKPGWVVKPLDVKTPDFDDDILF